MEMNATRVGLHELEKGKTFPNRHFIVVMEVSFCDISSATTECI